MDNKHRTKLLQRALFSVAFIIGVSAPFMVFAVEPHFVPSPNYGNMSGGYHGYSASSNYNSGGQIATGLSVSCSPSLITGTVGETVTWFSAVTGGNGSYFYLWNGTDGLYGNIGTLSKIYATSGEKFATLTVTSANQTVSVSCGSVLIRPAPQEYFSYQPGFGASCYATPERILPGESATWISIVSGVTASTTYEWDGTDDLAGNRPIVSKTYGALGNKFALLTVTKGNERVVAACTNSLAVGPKIAPAVKASLQPVAEKTPALKGICAASSAKAVVNDPVLWQTAFVGGNGTYSFIWSGDDSLAGNASTTLKNYETVGVKNASVEILSGSASTTVSCSPVEIITDRNGLMATVFFSGIGGPLLLFFTALLGGIIGFFIGSRRNADKTEVDGEKDHVE